MSVFCLELAPEPGTCIEDAFKEALRHANELGISILFYFNGRRCRVYPGGDATMHTSDFYASLNSQLK